MMLNKKKNGTTQGLQRLMCKDEVEWLANGFMDGNEVKTIEGEKKQA